MEIFILTSTEYEVSLAFIPYIFSNLIYFLINEMCASKTPCYQSYIKAIVGRYWIFSLNSTSIIARSIEGIEGKDFRVAKFDDEL